MHPSTVFPLHCGIYLSESTGNMEKYESLICLHLCERKKRGLFLPHGKLHQTVVFGNIKTYRDIEAFKLLNSGLWLHSSMTSLVSAPNKKINANICISQTSPFFCGSSPEPLCLASFNRAKESGITFPQRRLNCFYYFLLEQLLISFLESFQQDEYTSDTMDSNHPCQDLTDWNIFLQGQRFDFLRNLWFEDKWGFFLVLHLSSCFNELAHILSFPIPNW